MKKAAANLSQQFKVYVPSKRLPVFDQKRMLAKELQDFLHIYKKDTEQLKLDYNYDIEAQKQKDRKGSFNEILLINFLNKCTETQLEEIMSSYMKNSKDSSAFLGNKKSTVETSPHEDRKLNSASVSGKKYQTPASTSTLTDNIVKKQSNKNVTSVAISCKSRQKKIDDLDITENYENNIDNTNDSFSSSSNSSLNLSSEVPKPPQPEKSSTKINDEIRIQKGSVDRVKSALRINNPPIIKERVKSATQTEIDKIIFNKTYKNVNQSAAAMTINLQNHMENNQLLRKRKNSINFLFSKLINLIKI
jgi:hypothetical protein